MPILAVSSLTVFVFLLVLASLVAVVVERIPIPYTVALVLVGIILDALGIVPPTVLSPGLVLGLLLPPLLFEAAFALRWDELAPEAIPIVVLATLGVVLSAVVSAGILVFIAHFPWTLALLFGILVSATDPVAVVAFFQRARVAPSLRALVEGESLLNDGVAVVLAVVFASLAAGGRLQIAQTLGDILLAGLGGLAVGGVIGVAGSLLARGTSAYLVEATISVAIAYGSYLVGDELHVSGVLAVVGAGSVFGNFGRRYGIEPRTEEEIDRLWHFLAFVANSLVFLLLGSAVVVSALLRLGPLIGLGVVAALLGRAVTVYGLGGLLAVGHRNVPLPWRHVLFWGGLRGALPVVVAIVVTRDYQLAPLLQDLVLAVVLVTLLIQGVTLQPILVQVLHLPTAE